MKITIHLCVTHSITKMVKICNIPEWFDQNMDNLQVIC